MAIAVSDKAVEPDNLQNAINISFLSLTISFMNGTGKNLISKGKSFNISWVGTSISSTRQLGAVSTLIVTPLFKGYFRFSFNKFGSPWNINPPMMKRDSLARDIISISLFTILSGPYNNQIGAGTWGIWLS